MHLAMLGDLATTAYCRISLINTLLGCQDDFGRCPPGSLDNRRFSAVHYPSDPRRTPHEVGVATKSRAGVPWLRSRHSSANFARIPLKVRASRFPVVGPKPTTQALTADGSKGR